MRTPVAPNIACRQTAVAIRPSMRTRETGYRKFPLSVRLGHSDSRKKAAAVRLTPDQHQLRCHNKESRQYVAPTKSTPPWQERHVYTDVLMSRSAGMRVSGAAAISSRRSLFITPLGNDVDANVLQKLCRQNAASRDDYLIVLNRFHTVFEND